VKLRKGRGRTGSRNKPPTKPTGKKGEQKKRKNAATRASEHNHDLRRWTIKGIANKSHTTNDREFLQGEGGKCKYGLSSSRKVKYSKEGRGVSTDGHRLYVGNSWEKTPTSHREITWEGEVWIGREEPARLLMWRDTVITEQKV